MNKSSLLDPIEVLKLADASSDVYKKSSRSNILVPITLEELHARKVSALNNNQTGFKASVFRDEKDDVILSYKGTQGFKDWWYGNAQGLGLNTSQYIQAATVAKQMNREFGDKLKITGHSLGGGLATLAAAITNREATTFNSAGLHRNTLNHHQIDSNDFKEYAERGHIIRCVVKGEILNAIQDHTPLPSSIGHRENIIDPINPSTLGKHGMDSVKRALEHEVGKSALTEALRRPVSADELVSLIEKETNKDVLVIFAGNDNPDVQKALAVNPNTSVELLHHLSLNKNPQVREAVTKNNNTPVDIVYQMTKDKNKSVVTGAKKRMTIESVKEFIQKKDRGVEKSLDKGLER